MANNPRMAPNNKGKNAGQVARESLASRRSNPGAGVPKPPESNHAGLRSRNVLAQGKQARAQGGGGAGPVPAEKNAVDRTHERMAASKQARANRGQ